jgi:predicted amidophosphoribosyltransferase
MSFASRSENVSGAFFANSSIVKGKNVLIIDDVITSGSTMNSCATALLEADASEVYGFSLARAGVNDPQGSDNILPG